MVSHPMIGVRKKTYPKKTIAGKDTSYPANTCNLGRGYFCVLDNSMGVLDRDSKIAELKAFVTPAKKASRKKTGKVITDNQAEEVSKDES